MGNYLRGARPERLGHWLGNLTLVIVFVEKADHGTIGKVGIEGFVEPSTELACLPMSLSGQRRVPDNRQHFRLDSFVFDNPRPTGAWPMNRSIDAHFFEAPLPKAQGSGVHPAVAEHLIIGCSNKEQTDRIESTKTLVIQTAIYRQLQLFKGAVLLLGKL